MYKKELQVVLDTIKTRDAEENVLNYRVWSSGILLNDTVYTVVPNIATKTTLRVNIDPKILSTSEKISEANLKFENLFPQSTAYSEDEHGDDKYQGDDFLTKSSNIVKDSIYYVRVIYR